MTLSFNDFLNYFTIDLFIYRTFYDFHVIFMAIKGQHNII